MSKVAPWKDIPDTNLVPTDAYDLVVKELKESATKPKEDKQPKLMYVAQLKITAPKQYAGMVVFDRFTIGTEADPDGEDPETWKASFGARRLKQLVKACQVPLQGDMDDTAQAIEGQACQAMISLEPKHKDEATGVVYGESNQVTAYYKPGTMEPGSKKGEGAPVATSKPASPKAKPKPNGQDTGAGEEAPAPKAAAAKPKKSDMTKCPICNEDVVRTEFIQHVNGHDNSEEATE